MTRPASTTSASTAPATATERAPLTTFGITRSLNEVDIVRGSIERMLRQVDHVIVGDNSTDGTEKILRDLPVTLLWDDLPGVAQRDVMTRYAKMAGDLGATWVVPFDIDEVWYSPDGRRISDALADVDPSILIVAAANYTHTATALDDPEDLDPITRMGWRMTERLPLAKVACRVRPDLQIDHGNHSAHYDVVGLAAEGILEIRHFPYRDPEQFIKRVTTAWPQLRDSGLPEGHGLHMRLYGRALDRGGPEALRTWFREGMFAEDPESNPELVYDPCP